MQNEYRFKALVVRNVQQSDSADLLTVISAEYGKKTVKCYGARSLKRHFSAATKPFCYSDFLVTEKNGRWTLKEVQYLEPFFGLGSDIVSLALGQYILDLATESAQENENEEELLRVTLNCLYMLSRSYAAPRIVKTVYELRLIGALGAAPVYKRCARCGAALPDPCFFSASDGGTVCPACRDAAPELHYVPITGDTRRAIAHILLAPVKQLFSFRANDRCAHELGAISEECVLFFFEHNFESLKYYKKILEYGDDRDD